jgi:RecJ-like exonuclease
MDKTKEVKCLECEGKGYINLSCSYDDMHSKVDCTKCLGSGFITAKVICSKKDWIRMDREEAARKECELNKDRPLFDTELKINLFRIGGFKNES